MLREQKKTQNIKRTVKKSFLKLINSKENFD